MEVHADGSQCKPGFLCRNQDCKDADTPEHHFNLCPNAEAKKSSEGQKRSRFGPEGDKGRRKYTEEQEDSFGTSHLNWQTNAEMWFPILHPGLSILSKTNQAF